MPIERYSGSELPQSRELSPRPGVIDALRGTISNRIETTSHKPGEAGRRVKVNIVQEGAGLFGLPDVKDNKKWADVFDHSLLATRYAVHIAEKMKQSGHPVNSQALLDAMIVSRAGIRVWEEAQHFPEVAPQAKEKTAKSPEAVGLEIIQGKVPQDSYDLLTSFYQNDDDSLEHKIGKYILHRNVDYYQPLFRTMGNVMFNAFYEEEHSTQTKADVMVAIRSVIERKKGEHLGNTNCKPITLEEADTLFAENGAKAIAGTLSRKGVLKLVLQDAETEALLIKNGIHPTTITDKKIPMPAWEHELRLQYVDAAEPDILAEVFALEHQAKKGNKNAAYTLREDYSHFDWWGKYSIEMYEAWKGQKLETTSTYPIFTSTLPPKYNRRKKPTKTIHPDEKYL